MSLLVQHKNSNILNHYSYYLLTTLFACLFLIPLPAYAQTQVPDGVLDVLDNSCALWGCHAGPNPSKNLRLTRESLINSLVNKPSVEKPGVLRVKPGDPANSYLVWKIKGAPGIKGEQMPKGRVPLSESEIAAIESWIKSLPAKTKVDLPDQDHTQAFPGWTLSSLPTTKMLEPGVFLFRIAHRWRGLAEEGSDDLFGLDHGAHMFIQLAFPITDDLMVVSGRSTEKTTYEFSGKWRFLREKIDGSVPISAAISAGVDWVTVKEINHPDTPTADDYLSQSDGERFSWFAQMALSKRIHDRVSLLLVPGILLNGNVSITDENPIFTLGLAGKIIILKDFSLFVEAVPILSGDEDAATVEGPRIENGKKLFNDSFAAGLERRIGGHVFHLYVTNSLGLATNQYMSGGKFDFADGDVRLGFNIYRILNLPF